MSRDAGCLHHVELYAADFEASVRFRDWILSELGYEPYQRWDDGRSWRLGPTYRVVARAPTDGQERPFDRREPGLNHLAFHADSREQVDELTAGLRARGVRILYENDHPFAGGPDHYAVYAEDPMGIKVEVVAPGTDRTL